LIIQDFTKFNGETVTSGFWNIPKLRKEFFKDQLDADLKLAKAYSDAFIANPTDQDALSKISSQISSFGKTHLDFDALKSDTQSAKKALDDYATAFTNANTPAKRFAGTLKALGTSIANFGIEMLATLAIQALVKGIDAYVNRVKYAIDAADKLKETWNAATEEEKNAQDLVKNYGERYEELRKGVNNFGVNKTLNTEEYEEYLSISNKLADTFPELISGWDAQGNAILNVTDGVNGLNEALKNLVRNNREERLLQFSGEGFTGEMARVYSAEKGSYSKYSAMLNQARMLSEWGDAFKQTGAISSENAALVLGFDVFNDFWASEIHQKYADGFQEAYDVVSKIEGGVDPSLLGTTKEIAQENLRNAIDLLYGAYISASNNLLRQADYDLRGLKEQYSIIAANAFDEGGNPLYGGNYFGGKWSPSESVKNFFGQIPSTLGHEVFRHDLDIDKDGKVAYKEYESWFLDNYLEPLKNQTAQAAFESIIAASKDFSKGDMSYGDIKKAIEADGNLDLFGGELLNSLLEIVVGEYSEAANKALNMGLSDDEVKSLTSKELDFIRSMSGTEYPSITYLLLQQLMQEQKAKESRSIEALTESYTKYNETREKALSALNSMSEQGYFTLEQYADAKAGGYTDAIKRTQYGTEYVDYQTMRTIEQAKAEEEIINLTEARTKKVEECREAYDEFNRLVAEGKKAEAEEQRDLINGYETEIEQINLMTSAIEASTSALNAFKRASQMGELGDNFRATKDAIDAVTEGLESGRVGTNKFRAAVELIGGEEMLKDVQSGAFSRQELKDYVDKLGKFYDDGGEINRIAVFDQFAKAGYGRYFGSGENRRFELNKGITMAQIQEALGGVSEEYATYFLDAINEFAGNTGELLGPKEYRDGYYERQKALAEVQNMAVTASTVNLNAGNIEGLDDGKGAEEGGGKEPPPGNEPPPGKTAEEVKIPEELVNGLNQFAENIGKTEQVTAEQQQLLRDQLASYKDNADLMAHETYGALVGKLQNDIDQLKVIPPEVPKEEPTTKEPFEVSEKAIDLAVEKTLKNKAKAAEEELAVISSQMHKDLGEIITDANNKALTVAASGLNTEDANAALNKIAKTTAEQAQETINNAQDEAAKAIGLRKPEIDIEALETDITTKIDSFNSEMARISELKDRSEQLSALKDIQVQVSDFIDELAAYEDIDTGSQLASLQSLLDYINMMLEAASRIGDVNKKFTPLGVLGPAAASDVSSWGARPDTLDRGYGRKEKSGQELEGEAVEIEVELNTENAEEAASELEDRISGEYEMIVGVDVEEANMGVDESTSKIEETSTKPVEADTTSADESIEQLNDNIANVITKGVDPSEIESATQQAVTLNSLLAQTILKKVMVQQVDAGGTVTGGGAGGNMNSIMLAKVDGGKSLAGGTTLVGEIAPEIIVDRKTGTWRLAEYPQLTHLNPGDIVFNGKQTEAILNGRETYFSKALVDGNAYASGSAVDKFLNSNFSNKTVSTFKQSPATSYVASKLSNSSSADSKLLGDMITAAGKRGVELSRNSQSVPGGKSSGGGGGSGGGGEEEIERDWKDWIERVLEIAKKATEDAIDDIAEKVGYVAKNAQIDVAIKKNRNEIAQNKAAYDRYMQQAATVSLSADIIDKIQNGTIDITEYNSDIIDKIEEYEEWYNKALDCKDAIKELQKQELELKRQKLDSISEYFDNKIARLEAQLDKNTAKLDQKVAYGQEITTQDYVEAIRATQDKIAQLQREREVYSREFNSLVRSGDLIPESDAWFEYIEILEDIDESIIETETDLVNLKDEMENLPLTKLQYAYARLEAIQNRLEAFRGFHEAQGTKNTAESLIDLIGNGFEQIDNLEEQNDFLRDQQSGLDVLSEKWQELQDQIESNEQSIWDIKSAQEEWNDAIIDLQIDKLQEEREELEKTNEALEKRKEMEDALEDLEKAKQKTKLIYREGIGFQYEADQDAIREAQNRVDELRHQEMLDKIDEAIDALEETKKDDNVYDYAGIDVLKAFANGEGTKLYDFVHATTDLDKLLADKGYTAIVQSGADATKPMTIQIGDITLQGIQNVDALAQSIVNELPNKLIQKLYS